MTKHRNMYKKWHEDWIASDWHCKEKSKGNYTVTHKTHNKQWAKVKLGQEWLHELLWDNL